LVVLGTGIGSAAVEICSDSVAKEVHSAALDACSNSVVVRSDLTVKHSDFGLEEVVVAETKKQIQTVVR